VSGDLFNQWLSDLSTYFNQERPGPSLWGLIDGGISGLLGALLIIVAFIIFPLSYTLFTLFYALYGTVLYVVGPFVLASAARAGLWPDWREPIS
jgi:VIT1/CCC1 family predicted Fe2+/Mn2+ transporter